MSAAAATRGRGSDLLRWSGSVVAWALLLAVLALLVAAVAVPRVAGATPYTVLSDSMVPRYPAGTLLIIRPATPDRVAVGEVITYQLQSGRPEVVSHRVIGVTTNARGETTFRAQGDANAGPDPEPIRPEQVRGTLWYAVPYVGYATGWLAGPARVLVFAAVVVGLVGYAVAMFVLAARDRRRRPSDAAGTPPRRSSERADVAR